MTKYEYVGSHIILIKGGIVAGFISATVLSHFRIYSQLQNYCLMGHPITHAVFLVSEDNKLSEATIFKIKREMETEI